MRRRFVFDLDDTLESPGVYRDEVPEVTAWVKERWGDDGLKRMAFGWEYRTDPPSYDNGSYTFFAFPGAIELLAWTHSRGIAIDFFSGAIPERNEHLCKLMMEAAFPDGDIPPYRVFSTRIHSPADDHREDYREKYVGFFYGQRKKALRDFIVPEDEVSDTLLIEDDSSYAAKDEEGNLVLYNCGCSVFTGLKSSIEAGYDIGKYGLDMAHVFYLAGLLDRILEVADEKNISLRDAAVQVQYTDEGLKFPDSADEYHKRRSERFDRTYPYMHDKKYFMRGLKILQQFNPALDFWNGISDFWWDENGYSLRDAYWRNQVKGE